MECVQVGLEQGGFWGLGFKRTAQQLLLSPENVSSQSGAVASSGDDSFVDQLLNLNSENTQEECSLLVDDQHQETHQQNGNDSAFVSPAPPLQPPSTTCEDDFDSLLILPEEEPDLEWLSQFVEDSFSQFNHAAGSVQPVKTEPETPQNPCRFSPPAVLPRSRRSKRLRPAFSASGRGWALAAPPAGSPAMSSESATSSSPSSSATSSPYWPTSPSTPLALHDPNPKKKQKNGWAKSSGESGSGSSTRRCSHCGTQKTPQWRAGPMGAKTLCNACGVRFKSGRLLPEYRPACSPTFSSELHSNSHRKVLEMRRKKESMGQPEPGFVPAVQSFG